MGQVVDWPRVWHAYAIWRYLNVNCKLNYRCSCTAFNCNVKCAVEQKMLIIPVLKILIFYFFAGRRRHRLYTNITITGYSKNDRQHRKCEIQIEFLGSMDDYCSPGLHMCFPSRKAVYSVPEDSMIEQNLDFLMNPALLAVCHNISVQYNTILGKYKLVYSLLVCVWFFNVLLLNSNFFSIYVVNCICFLNSEAFFTINVFIYILYYR